MKSMRKIQSGLIILRTTKQRGLCKNEIFFMIKTNRGIKY